MSGTKTHPSFFHKTKYIVCCKCDQLIHALSKRGTSVSLPMECYGKGSLGKGILIKQSLGLVLEAYSNIIDVGSVVDRRSTT